MSLELRPLTLAQANALVAALHRHHKPCTGHRFSIGAFDGDKNVGAAIVGRPVARAVDQNNVCEVSRLVTDGTKNACSILYAAAARAAEAMGYQRIQTYILDSEPGTSLRASGWTHEGNTKGRDWNAGGERTHKNRRTDQPMCDKQRWSRVFKGAAR